MKKTGKIIIYILEHNNSNQQKLQVVPVGVALRLLKMPTFRNENEYYLVKGFNDSITNNEGIPMLYCMETCPSAQGCYYMSQSLGINENVHGIHLLASSHTDNDGKELITFVDPLLAKYMSIVCICIGFPKYENVASTYLDATQLWIAETNCCHSSSLQILQVQNCLQWLNTLTTQQPLISQL